MGGSAPLEIERKYLVEPGPDAGRHLAGAHAAELTQTYLRVDGEGSARVRRRQDPAGVRFFHTVKRPVSPGVREEDEREVDADEYAELLADADPARVPVVKTRYTFRYGGHVLELDQLHAPRELWLLEVEFDDVAGLTAEIALPPWLVVHREVTGDPAFSNSAIARAGADGDSGEGGPG